MAVQGRSGCMPTLDRAQIDRVRASASILTITKDGR